ncbi:MAG: hypothetical protein LBP42_07380 [Treponema sp.]|jgi:hypothetical protein|nr:hypothetical protein [Treponema sp.]
MEMSAFPYAVITNNSRLLTGTQAQPPLLKNHKNLEGARGLRIGIVPVSQGRDDRIRKDEQKNLVICPLPYDGSFMELFYTGWRIVQQFLYADATLPFEVSLPNPNPPERQVARELEMRREFNVLDIVQALEPQSQSNLLTTEIREVNSAEHSHHLFFNPIKANPRTSPLYM